jgi:deoxycytidylate deaminase
MIISDGFNGMPSGLDNCCETNGETNWMLFTQKKMQL